jgi:hypothetical protein
MRYKDSMNTFTTCTRCGELIPVSEQCPCQTTPMDRLDTWLDELDSLDLDEPTPPKPPKPAPVLRIVPEPAPFILSADPALPAGSGYTSLAVAERVHTDTENTPQPIYYGRAS